MYSSPDVESWSEETEGIQLGTAFSDRINIGDNKLNPNKCLRKRKRQQFQDDDTSSSNTTHAIEIPLSHICPPPLAFPKSAYSGSLPSLPRFTETSVLREILADEDRQRSADSEDGGSFSEAMLDGFSIYRTHQMRSQKKHKRPEESSQANELVSLHEINERNVGRLCFDGWIIDGEKARYVENVLFSIMAIGGYKELDRPTVGSEIWIQSAQSQKAGVWYRLRTPAPEYRRLHEPSLWIADLAKHVVDYLHIHWQVTLNHFRERFHTWMQSLYGSNAHACNWLNCGSRDFRRIVAAHANFLYCQASQVDHRLEDHPVWKEIHPRFLSAIEEQVERGTTLDMYTLSTRGSTTSSRRKTTVNQYVYKCFENLTWAKFLYSQTPSISVATRSSCLNGGPGLPSGLSEVHVYAQVSSPSEIKSRSIHKGDVVALPRDKESPWKTIDTHWYGYVHGIKESSKGPTLELLWLYRPSDTECRKMHYPFAKELFLSDHCNCGDAPILVQEVTHRPRVAFFGTPDTEDVDFFVRQTYIQGHGAWESLKDSDFSCRCYKKEEFSQYSAGDTLLVRIRGLLEPVVFIEEDYRDLQGKFRVRRLLRMRDYGHMDAEPNELVISNKFQSIARTDVDRECHVRFYTEENKTLGQIPPPYCRRGSSDHYYIILEDLDDSELGPRPFSSTSLKLINQGWNPAICYSGVQCEDLIYTVVGGILAVDWRREGL